MPELKRSREVILALVSESITKQIPPDFPGLTDVDSVATPMDFSGGSYFPENEIFSASHGN